MRRQPIVDVIFGVGTPEPKRTPQFKEAPRVAFQLHDDEQVTITVEALDAEGNPAAASTTIGPSSDETVASVTDNGDGTALVVASPGAGGLGSASIPVSVTDNSDGDIHTGSFDVEVIAGDAVSVNVTAGTPEPKPIP